MPKMPEVITKKIGPLPLWGWVVAGAGAVFVFSRFKGGSSSGNTAGGIGIPVLRPGGTGSISDGGNAVGSPGQNAQGGSDTQPGGAPPNYIPNPGPPWPPGNPNNPPWWWGEGGPVLPWLAGGTGGSGVTTVRNSPGGNPGGATAGPNIDAITTVAGLNALPPPPTAASLAVEPAGGWKTPPAFQQTSPTTVIVPTQGVGNTGVVNPKNKLLGYANPKTGEIVQIPVPGWAAIWV